MPSVLVRSALVLLASTLLIGVHPSPAGADASQLCRSISSIALAPTDVAFGPIIAAKDIWYGMSEWDDPVMLRMVGVLPGYVYLNAMQFGGSLLRVVGGVIEFPMGLFTLFREGAQGWLFRAHADMYALYSAEFGPCPVRIGSSYNSIND